MDGRGGEDGDEAVKGEEAGLRLTLYNYQATFVTVPAPPAAPPPDAPHFASPRHPTLWTFQWARWCSREQYDTALHAVHFFFAFAAQEGSPHRISFSIPPAPSRAAPPGPGPSGSFPSGASPFRVGPPWPFPSPTPPPAAPPCITGVFEKLDDLSNRVFEPL